MKILIADDSVVSRHLLEVTLRETGFDVVPACDGNEAWKILQGDDPPAIAVLDWMMPGMTGLEVCRRLRQQARQPYTYVLLVTSRAMREDLIEGLESGADDYVIKPFDRTELQVRLRAGKRLTDLQAELLETREALREQATRDALTGLWNRSTILQMLEAEIARSERENRPLGLALLDLDHFKLINDTWGHYGGDLVLQAASRRMLNCIRAYDSIGRYGGEEFLLLLPGCGEECTAAQAERIRTHLCQTPFDVGEASISVTASFGCASTFPARTGSAVAAPVTPESLIRQADAALYRAKGLGRNRVESGTAQAGVHSAEGQEMAPAER